MSIGRRLAIVVAVLLALLLAVILYVNFADLNRYRPRIEAMVSDATGRQFTMAGELSLHLGFPISFEAKQVSLANTEWGSEPTMLDVGTLYAEIAPASLFSGPLRIDRFSLEGVALLFESNEEGMSNWDLDNGQTEQAAKSPPEATPEQSNETKTPEGTPAAEPAGLPAMVFAASAQQVAVTLRRPDKADLNLTVADFEMLPNDDGNMDLNIRGEFLDAPIVLSGELGTQEQIEALGQVDFQLAGQLGAFDVKLDGAVDNLEQLSGSRLEANLHTPDITQLLSRLEAQLPLTGEVSVNAQLAERDGELTVSYEATATEVNSTGNASLTQGQLHAEGEIGPAAALGLLYDVENLPADNLAIKGLIALDGEAPRIESLRAHLAGAELTVSGTLASEGKPTQLDISVRSDNLHKLLPNLPELPFTGKTRLSLSDALVEADELVLSAGESDLTGKISLTSGARTSLSANLASKRFDLRPFGAVDNEDGADATPTSPKEPAGATDPSPQPSEYVFIEEPLPFEALATNDLNITLSVDELVSETLSRKDVKINARLQDGKLEATTHFLTARDGRASAIVQLLAKGKHATLKAEVMARGLRLNLFSGDVDNYTQIPPTDATITLESHGASPRELAANSNGQLLITSGAGRMDNTLLDRFSGDILAQLATSLNPVAKSEPYSNFECGIILMKIEEGVSKLDTVIIQGEKIMVVAGGQVDLNNEQLNIEFNTKPRKGVGISADMFVTPFVALKGTLASPGIGVNQKGTLLTAGAAAATGGLSLLIQTAFDRATAAVDHCQKTLPEHPQPPYRKVG